jgi:ribosome biogenesis GTPase
MYFLPNGGIVIDNPGMREIGMTNVTQGVNEFFNQISELALGCKFNDCTHTQEKGCAVLKALKNGEIDQEKYQNYINLKKESEFYEMSETEKKRKEKDFGKFLKSAKKDLKTHGHKNY